jgi:hypothetical protein
VSLLCLGNAWRKRVFRVTWPGRAVLIDLPFGAICGENAARFFFIKMFYTKKKFYFDLIFLLSIKIKYKDLVDISSLREFLEAYHFYFWFPMAEMSLHLSSF